MPIFTTLIVPDELRSLLDDPDLVVFDCSFDLGDPQRGADLYNRGHIPGAHYLHLDADLSAPPSGSNGRHPLPDPAILAAKLRTAGTNRTSQIVAYDNAGGCYAARLWWLARWLGHERVAVLDGAMAAWIAAGGPVEQLVPPVGAPGDFEPGPLSRERTVLADELLANIDDKKLLVLDARSPERFAGEPNALDPVAGHIPGACNHFFKDNLDQAGRFKPAAQLTRAFDDILHGFAPGNVVLQCGSGVTACHNALAMAVAGRGGAMLYPGSWSEWIADPARPVERNAS